MSHSCPLKEDYLTNNRQELQLRNPFKAYFQDRDAIDANLADLYAYVFTMQNEIKELREEVDYLVDALDD